jgi:hypothetical protein
MNDYAMSSCWSAILGPGSSCRSHYSLYAKRDTGANALGPFSNTSKDKDPAISFNGDILCTGNFQITAVSATDRTTRDLATIRAHKSQSETLNNAY